MSTGSPKPSPSRDGLLRQLKEHVFGCFGHTTAHGYGRIAASTESRTLKWFWLIVCCGAFCIFAVQLVLTTKQYMSRPLKTRITITRDRKLAFPQVTICNLNIIRKSKLPKDILQKFPELLGGVLKQTKENATQQKSAGSSVKNPLPNFDDLSDRNKLIQRVRNELTRIPIASLKSYGHQIDDMILSCEYHHFDCLDDDLRNQAWTGFWHREYGNCFTFNKGIDENGKQTDVVTSSQPGLGLTLEINIEQAEYISELSQEAGIRVFIGGQGDMPFPYEQGKSVSPGFSTAIELRKVVVGRLDPFSNKSCVDSDNKINSANIYAGFNVRYSTMACKMSCLATLMNERCGCVWFALKYNEFSLCNSENASVVYCANKVFEEFDNGFCESRCKEKCREDTFKVTTSLAKWPSKQYMNSLIADIEKEAPNMGNFSAELSDHFLKLKIYYGELNYEVIEEEEAYSFEGFISDIGGLMGMWIGISMLTVVEVFELTATLLIAVFRNVTKKKSQVVNVKPQNTEDNSQRF